MYALHAVNSFYFPFNELQIIVKIFQFVNSVKKLMKATVLKNCSTCQPSMCSYEPSKRYFRVP